MLSRITPPTGITTTGGVTFLNVKPHGKRGKSFHGRKLKINVSSTHHKVRFPWPDDDVPDIFFCNVTKEWIKPDKKFTGVMYGPSAIRAPKSV